MDLKQLFDLSKLDELLSAKTKYGRLFLFRNKDIVSVFRPLTIAESKALENLSESLEEAAIDDWVFSKTYITSNKDKDYLLNKTPYLYVPYVAKKIGELSFLHGEKDFVKSVLLAREQSSTVQDIVNLIISKGYGIELSDVENLTQARQLELLPIAEHISGNSLDITSKRNKQSLRKFTEGAQVIGGEVDITSPEAADKPDFNETF